MYPLYVRRPPAVGDYVIAASHVDGDPRDTWAAGCVYAYYEDSVGHDGCRYDISPTATLPPLSLTFRRVMRVSVRRGQWMLANYDLIAGSGHSIWYWALKPMVYRLRPREKL